MVQRRRIRRVVERGVTLVEVLIVITIMALISGTAVVLVFPKLKEARIKTAMVNARQIRDQAELHQQMDGASDQCPTIQELVASKKVDAKTTEDPWSTPYKIVCADGDIRVLSFGADKKEGTPDDIRDDFRDSDVKRIAEK